MNDVIDWFILPNAPTEELFIVNVDDEQLKQLQGRSETVEFRVADGSTVRATFDSIHAETGPDGEKRNLVWYRRI